MTSIVTNSAALAAVRTLSDLNGQMTKTQARINTGLKVNQASDDPAVFSIAQGMRATMGGLTAVQDGLSFGHAVIATGSAAMVQIAAELTALKQTVTQGQTTGMTSTDINAQITASLANIDSYANSAVFNGINLCNAVAAGALNMLTDVSGTQTQVAGACVTSGGLGLASLSVASASTDLNINATTAIAMNDTITIADTTAATSKIFEFSDGSGALSATATATTSVTAVVFATTDSPAQIMAKLQTAMAGNGVTSQLSGSGTMTINNVASANVTVTVAGTAPVKTATPGSAAPIAAVDAAITSLNSAMSALGSKTKLVEGQQAFSKSLMNSLTEGLGALVDADMAEQSAQLQSLQTRNQLALQTLSIANQQPQSIMSLFR